MCGCDPCFCCKHWSRQWEMFGWHLFTLQTLKSSIQDCVLVTLVSVANTEVVNRRCVDDTCLRCKHGSRHVNTRCVDDPCLRCKHWSRQYKIVCVDVTCLGCKHWSRHVNTRCVDDPCLRCKHWSRQYKIVCGWPLFTLQTLKSSIQDCVCRWHLFTLQTLKSSRQYQMCGWHLFTLQTRKSSIRDCVGDPGLVYNYVCCQALEVVNKAMCWCCECDSCLPHLTQPTEPVLPVM